MECNLVNIKKIIEVISKSEIEFEKKSIEEGCFNNLQVLVKKLTATEFNGLLENQNYENTLRNDFYSLINYCNNNNISYE